MHQLSPEIWRRPGDKRLSPEGVAGRLVYHHVYQRGLRREKLAEMLRGAYRHHVASSRP